MGKPFQSEVTAIQTLRSNHPNVPQSKLAKQISARSFTNTADNVLAGKVPTSRTFYSVYSVIRRYDAKQKKAAASDRVRSRHQPVKHRRGA